MPHHNSSLEKKNRSTLKHRIRLDFPRLENFKVPTNFDGRRASVGQQVYHVELIRNKNRHVLSFKSK